MNWFKGYQRTHESVVAFDAPFLTSGGTDPSLRAQNQILMNCGVRSIAYLTLS
jgi:hypothetical protein